MRLLSVLALGVVDSSMESIEGYVTARFPLTFVPADSSRESNEGYVNVRFPLTFVLVVAFSVENTVSH